MGQVWSSADFDGIAEFGRDGGSGSALAVTAQNFGPDGRPFTQDDLVALINQVPVDVSVDRSADDNNRNNEDRVRGFHSFHSGGSFFTFGDGSVRLLEQGIDAQVYMGLSTISGKEIIPTL